MSVQHGDGAASIEVEVVFADPDKQSLIRLSVPQGSTALEAVKRSGILAQFPHLELDKASFGIFSRLLDGRSTPAVDEYVLEAGERVEIYRPLLIDPKQARLRRAARAKKA